MRLWCYGDWIWAAFTGLFSRIKLRERLPSIHGKSNFLLLPRKVFDSISVRGEWSGWAISSFPKFGESGYKSFLNSELVFDVTVLHWQILRSHRAPRVSDAITPPFPIYVLWYLAASTSFFQMRDTQSHFWSFSSTGISMNAFVHQ